jgi:hypothetical protein
MVNSWIQATKLYNDKHNTSGVPKKGTDSYETIKRIQEELKRRALADKPVIKPVEEPVVKPIEEPVVKPIEEPVVKPIKKPVVKPIKKPVVKPVEGPKNTKKNAFKTK